MRPRIAAKARLRLDRKSGQHVLLYPERGLVLNRTAADIVELCRGERTVEEIIELLAERHGTSREEIEPEVRSFLDALRDRGLLESS